VAFELKSTPNLEAQCGFSLSNNNPVWNWIFTTHCDAN